MAKFRIDWLAKKNEDWQVATLIGEDGKGVNEVSINRKSKKGEIFPNFDALMPGGEVEGELWQSTGGKWYLFPPREAISPVAQRSAAYKGKMIEEAQTRKAEQIRTFQGDKEYSIKVSSTFRAAVDSAIAEYQEQRRISLTSAEPLDKLFEKWREYYWMSFDVNEDKDYPPFK